MNLLLRKTENRSRPNRRDFMLQTGCASLGITTAVNTLAQLKLTGAAAAQGAGDDYKALVCVFLNGGCDTNNMLIPAGTTSAARSDYGSGRGVLSIPNTQFDFTPAANNGYFNGTSITTDPVTSRISPSNGSSTGSQFDPANRPNYTQGEFAVHMGAYPLKGLFDTGDLAFVANIGTLIGTQQITRANFNTLPASTKPPQLFSHSDQQVQWQSSLPDKPFTQGWGGRIAEIVAGLNEGDLGVSVSIAGSNSFQIGLTEQPYFMNTSGAVTSLTGFSGGTPTHPYGSALRNTGLNPDYTNPSSLGGTKYNPLAGIGSLTGVADPLSGTNYQNSSAGWRLRALEQVLAASHNSLFDENYVNVPKSARNTEGLVGAALGQTIDPNDGTITINSHWSNWFPGGFGQTDLSNQLKVVARMIAGRSALSNKRQIFFVQIGGWDTHTSQIPNPTAQNQGYYSLINNLSRSIRAFADCMKAIGMWDKVTMFTASDFNRTFTPNKNDATGGSDHAWGGTSVIAGGAVNGGKIYGTFPDLTVNGGIDCTGNRGRWIPTTSVDQKAALIGKWFGLSDAQVSQVFPNLTRFQPDLSPATLQARNLDMIDFNVG
ncbi:MAG: DUF1501 domain-containing protein [Verrucomicrobiaceae bacterium]|nr:DUF1501 domain-containing protein [Verrucomicrobiaceae bacterium]